MTIIIYNGTYCVYAHINKINGKIYIGQTVHGDNPNRRWDNGRSYKHSSHFYASIQKYGWDNFDHEVIANNLTLEEANKFETLLIEKLNTTDRRKGYNIAKGGRNAVMSEETRKKISKANKGRKLSQETIAKMIESRKNYRPTEETRRKMGNARRGIKNWNSKPVYQYDLQTGDLIFKWDYMGQAAEFIGSTVSDICACCAGTTKSTKGFIWSYELLTQDEIDKKIENKKINKNPCSKPVVQYSKDGKFIKKWANCALPERELGIYNINNCCKGKQKLAGGFIWMFESEVTDELISLRVNKANAEIKRSNLRGVKQYTKDGVLAKEWDSMAKAAKEYETTNQHIYECCKGIRKSEKGFIWTYLDATIEEVGKRVEWLQSNTHKPPIHTKPVKQFTLDGEFIKEYQSITLAKETLGINVNHIGSCCNGKRKTAGGYIWKYAE